MLTEEITLSEDQEKAQEAFKIFIVDPIETVFVLSGFSGCGKSTLVKKLLEMLPSYTKTAKLIDPTHKELVVQLTATTNKAAENLRQITNEEVITIHSFLGLRVQTDFKTGNTTLLPTKKDKIEGHLIFIDEASYIDKQLLDFIFKGTSNCKFVFIGDPAQLTPVKSVGVPVFDANFNGAALTKVVRQAEGNPIVELSTMFRNFVNTGVMVPFKPDGHFIQHMDRATFNSAIEQEFSRSNWKYQDSKVLAWTNKCVISYNQYVRNYVKGDPHFEPGDYAVCNSYVSINRKPIKTDQLVMINTISDNYLKHGVMGKDYTIDGSIQAFMPNSLSEKNTRLTQAKRDGDYHIVAEIDGQWIDLRAAYACTINKAQGSTYDVVFIDLDDIARCNSQDQVARMLYVAVSRARNHVYLTGDLV
jgi:ATP-dependent exoDNAse (exonuclease V) alpha subunit